MARTSPRWSSLWLAAAICLSATSASPIPLSRPSAPAALSASAAAGDSSYRLPGEARPLHYDIHITPTVGPTEFRFDAEVNIIFQAVTNSPNLTLHADRLEAIKCTLDADVPLAEPTKDEERQFITFDLKKPLVAGKQHQLSCTYSGTVGDDDKGFYRSSYYDEAADRLKWFGITQFEMTFARRALPCFDEPGYRATFVLSITHSKDLQAVSNTRPNTITTVKSSDDLVTTTFDPTPAMAVYTLAWMVSELPARANDAKDFRTFAQPSQLDRTALSQAVGPQVLRHMEEYTGIQYQLDKMDQVAVPDHNFGAMENWGLVTYRQALLLADATSRADTTLSVTTVIAHELVHQWFGNLVTPSWWSHVWLSEAFAEYFCYVMTDKINPAWNVMDKMPLLEMHDAFAEDALATASAMNHEVFTPDEILDNFGSITYAKGSCVLRMLDDAINDVVGSNKFQTGLQDYLNAMMETGVVEPDDLWKALDNVANQSDLLSAAFKDMAKTWTDQPGYPLVTVTRKGDTATLTQARFFSSGPKEDSTLWKIPMRWRLEGVEPLMRFRLDEKSHDMNLIHGESQWILINANQIGYFRVQYDDDNWRALSAALLKNATALSVSERAMLVDDALVLARAGMLSYDVALGLVEYLRQEAAYAPWAAFQDNIEYIAMLMRAGTDEEATLFNTWVQGLSHKAFNALSMQPWQNEPFEDHLTRGVVVRVAYEANDTFAISEARLKFLDWQDGNAVDPDSLRVILCEGLKDEAVFVDLLDMLADSEDEAKRADLTYALGCAPEKDELSLKTKLIETIIYETGLRAKDVKALWKSLVSTADGLTFAVNYLIDNSADLAASAKVGPTKLGEMFKTIAPRIASQANYDKLAEFAKQQEGTPMADALSKALASAKTNLDWKAAHYDSIVAYLKPTQPTREPTTVTASPTLEPTPSPSPSPSSYRLPQTVSPSQYVLILTIDDSAKSFDGMLGVSVMAVDEDIQAITMHAADLVFGPQNVTLTADFGSKAIAVTAVKFEASLEQVTISLATAMAPGAPYTLAINYTGTLRDDFTGLYRAQLGTGTGKMIGTQMYPAYARRVLPCWDEPRYRVSMQVSVQHDPSYVAVSSTPVIDNDYGDSEDDAVLDVFTPTGPIPASQLAVYLLDASLTTSKLSNKGLTTLYALKEVFAEAADTLTQTDALLDWFATQTGADAGLEQLSLVGVTNSLDEANDAWGLFALRDHNLADLDASPSSGESEQTWLLQLGRHLAQLWFGDLVGVEWWNDAWLREGFTTFYQYIAPETVETSWKLRGQLYTRAVSPALHADSFEGAHPLNDGDVSGSQESIANHLDVITSGKGAAVVHMLSHALEKNGIFAAGLQGYVKNNKDSIARADDLYEAMQTAVKALDTENTLPDGVTVADVLKTWVDHSGYPVVNAIRDYDKKTASLSQERFLLHTPSSSSGAAGRWWVPLSYALRAEYMSVHETPLKAWLQPGQTLEVKLDDADANTDFLLVNADRTDFFRVNYDIHNWMLLRRYMDEYHTLVNTEARAALVDDALALARSGRLDYAVALEVADYLRVDYDLAPWEAARAGFDYLSAQLFESHHEAVYKTWLLQLLDTVFQQSNFFPEDRDTHVQRLARAVSTAWACELGHKNCVRYAARDFSQWLDDSNSVGHDTLAATACAGLRGSDDDNDFKTVLTKLRVQQEDALRAAIIQGLGCVTGDNVRAVLDLTISASSGLRRGEAALVWKAVSRFGPSSVDTSLAYLVTNIDAVIAVSGKAAAKSIIEVLANRVTTQSQYEKLSSLASRVDATRLTGALRLAKDNIEWRATYLDVVADKLYALTNTTDPDLPTSPAPPTTPTTPAPTLPTGVTDNDPPTRTPGTTSSYWTLPPTQPTSPVTMPTLPPTTTGNPSDPPTKTPGTTSSYWTLPPTQPTSPVTMPTLPPTTTGNPSDPPTKTPGTTSSYWTLPPTQPTSPVTMPTLYPTTTGNPSDPPTKTPGTTSSYWTLPPTQPTSPITMPTLPPTTTGNPSDPPTKTPGTTSSYWTLPPTQPTSPVTLPPMPTVPTRAPTLPTGVTDTDPPTRTPGTTPSAWTLPPTGPQTTQTLPPLTEAPKTTPGTATSTEEPPTRKPNGAAGLASSVVLLVVSILALHATWA